MSQEESGSSQDQEDQVSSQDPLIVDLIGDESAGSANQLSGKRRSQIYEHFGWEPEKKIWKCNYCNRVYSSGIGSLNNHIRRNHPNHLKSKQSEITSHFPHLSQSQDLKSQSKPEITQDGLDKRLIEFIITSDQPFSLVQEEKFQDLINYLLPTNTAVTLPGRKAIRSRISTFYVNKKQELKTILCNNASKISFTVDCWTSSNNHAFQGVIASWIDENWIPHDVVMDVTLLNGSHTGRNLAHRFSQILDEYNLWQKMLCYASNMGTFFTELDRISQQKQSNFESKNYRIRCMAHVLNLACQETLKSVDTGYGQNEEDNDNDEVDRDFGDVNALNIVRKIRKAVVAIRSSPQRTEMFEGQCRLCNFNPRKLIRDVRTRWNSTLEMLERALEMRQALEMTITACDYLARFRLTDEEWIGVGQLIEILKPFRDATLLLSTNQEPTLSNTVVVYEILFSHFETYIQAGQGNTTYRRVRVQASPFPQWLIDAALCGWKKLKDYYPTVDGLAYTVATVLDPRFKDKWYVTAGWEREWINSNKRSVKQLWTSEYNKDTQRSLEPREQPSHLINPIQDKISAQMKTLQRGENSTDELTRYLKEVVVMQEMLNDNNSQMKGILGWWKIHQHQYPQLSMMARDFLAVTGTGVPVERLFSTASDLLAPRRQRLSPESINECLCLKNWYKRKIDLSIPNIREDISKGIQFKVFGELVPHIPETITSAE